MELAPLADPGLLFTTLAQAIGTAETGEAWSAVRSWCRGRHALLVLDNLEHLLAAAPDLAGLLSASPRLHVLATSRSPLRVRGEQEVLVPPLQSPPTGRSGQEVAEFSAVRLFLWQARRRDPAFAPTGDDAAAVAAICRRVDGLPLALELVAARTKVLGPAELLAHVDDLMPLLVGGTRDLPPRQRTMRAAIAWSEDLLQPAEQTVFRRLSVFAGGWTLDAAEAVAAEHRVLDHLDALVEQSLVTAVHGPGGTRYGMLEPVRHYARERLVAENEEEPARRRHARYFMALAEQAAGGIEGRPGQAAWADRLHREQDNIRAALAWSEHADGAAETGLRLATALWRFWEMRWQVEEGSRWLTGALARSAGLPAGLRANALNAAGNLAGDRGDDERATAYHEECLTIRREQGDVRGVAVSLNNLGVLARNRQDPERTRQLCRESLELFRSVDDRHGAAIALISLGAAAAQQRDLALAQAHYEESLRLFRAEDDDWHTAWVLTYLAEVLVQTTQVAAARSLAGEGLALHRVTGDPWGAATALGVLGRADMSEGSLATAADRFGEAVRLVAQARVERALPSCLDDLAGVLLASGHPREAARLAGAAEAVRAVAGAVSRAPQPPDGRAALDALRTGPHGGDWQEGRALAREQVLAETARATAVVADR